METTAIVIFGAGTVASCAAIVAAANDRFHKVAASSAALVAGILPWLFFLMWHRYLPSSNPLAVISIFGSGPMFLGAFFLYGVGQITPSRSIAAGAALIGMFAGGGFSIALSSLLSRME